MKKVNIIIFISLIALSYMFFLCVEQRNNYESAIAIKDKHIQELKEVNDEIFQMYSDTYNELELLKSVDLETYQKVRFTNYHENDGSSNNVTGSGLTTADFEINSKGWYTYKGKVVVATATWQCINSDVGACEQYTSVPRGYSVYNYEDELEIIVDGVIYQAIVLDSCGASYWNEKYQRIDIFIADESKAFHSAIGYAR